MRIDDLVWDSFNSIHIVKHGVAKSEIYELVRNDPFTSITRQSRVRLIGRTDTGRVLTVILAYKIADMYYAISARPASRKERFEYEIWKSKNYKNS